ncbi:protein phosphatase 1 regulatory subunit 3A [Tiliqua scincoides]|uniref:protein phosphatase 1 regulatory subunit 3A n=1 Tax=Tiliqua scincoides TaxID=71010 RepID=UPI0034625682
MESFEEPGHISRENLLEVPPLNDSLSEDEDVKVTIQSRFSPSPRRRNSDSSEEMEPEVPSTIARKVSFADAFGFDLVSVKEFDTWEVQPPLPNDDDDLEAEVVPVEEFYLTPLFTPPATQEELLQKVRAQKVWLQSVEFLPGITCMKGTVRVLNVSFKKLVYVRMTLDNWLTYYDILADYVPNSCDGETDQFLFKISLVPPYQRDGAKVEFCIRYETSAGIFWANNDNHNYILICHKKETITAPPVEDNQHQEEVTDKHRKGCLKSTQSSKEEILTSADEDTWNNPRTSGSDIPEILYSFVDDNKIKESEEKVKGKNVELNEDDNEDNEKELELLLSQHFTRARGSLRDEKSLYTTGPVQFQNEPQDLEDKLDSGLVRQPLPIMSECVLQEQELHNTQMYSMGKNYSQSPQEKFIAIDSENNSTPSSEPLSTSEILLPREFGSETKESETSHVTGDIASKQGMSPADFPKSESDSTPESKTTETLFISEDDYDHHKEAGERSPKSFCSDDDKVIHFQEKVLERLDDMAKPVHEKHMDKTSPPMPELVLENIVKPEPKEDRSESKNQVYLKKELNANPLTDVTITSLRSSHADDDIVEENYRSEYKVEKGKEIKLSMLEQSSEKEQACPFTLMPTNRHEKYVSEMQNKPLLPTSRNDEGSTMNELNRGREVIAQCVLGEKEDEEVHGFVESPWLNYRGSSGKINKEQKSTSPVVDELSQDWKRTDNRYPEDIQSTRKYCINYPAVVIASGEGLSTHSPSINVENVFDPRGDLEPGTYSQSCDPANGSILEKESCQTELDRVITDDQSSQVGWGNQSWSGLESQLAQGESGASERVQMKERTGGEAMWGIRDNTRCLNVTPTDELFTCQDPMRYEESSVAERGSTGEAEAVTAAYIIKMTSESAPEKMSAGEKAVIVKLPQETALSDRPTEGKETVFDIHEGRNDGSHYPLCQCNTVGVLYDTKFEKESVSDIYNARMLETLRGEMMSVCGASEKLVREECDSGNRAPPGEIVWTSDVEGKAASEEGFCSETPLEASPCPQQGLYHKEAELGDVWGTFSYEGTKTGNISPSGINIMEISCESSSMTSSEESAGVHTAEDGRAPHGNMDLSADAAAELGCDSSSTSDVAHHIPKVSLEDELGELPQSSMALPSTEKGERSVGHFCHQPEVSQGKILGPTILIREPTEERDETPSQSEGLITEEKRLNWDTEGQDKQSVGQEDISNQSSEACGLSECLVLKHIGYKILYFLLFVVFCVTMYHYDLIVCFALYLFSLYWLYCEGEKSKESVKKE